jgi:hypothetical protein
MPKYTPEAIIVRTAVDEIGFSIKCRQNTRRESG